MTRIKEKISNKGMIVYLTKIIGRQGTANSLENWYIHLGSDRVGFCAQFSMRNTKIAVV